MQGVARMMCRHRRRKHLRNRIMKYIYIFLCLLAIFFLYKYTHPKMEFTETSTYFVETDDTLWDIANDNTSEDMDVREYLDIVYKLNKGLTPDIKCGQAVVLPVLIK